MPFQEVFVNPTVKQVIFQIVFPKFFSIEAKIGEYQLRIMDMFPASQLLIQNQFFIASNLQPTDPNRPLDAQKIWQFQTVGGDITINVTSDSLSIVSTKHKTYNNQHSPDKFRDVITQVIPRFLEVIPLVRISRIGLRYINECPLPNELNNDSFLSYYNSFINFERIDNILDCESLLFNSNINYGDLIVRYSETFTKSVSKYTYTLDFDGQINNVASGNYLISLDQIHERIGDCFEEIVKEPVIQIMRNGN